MIQYQTKGQRVFNFFNIIFLATTALICLLPLVNVLAVSFSSKAAAAAGYVNFWPVDFTTASYEYALSKNEFIRAFYVSLKRVGLGLAVNLTLTILVAFPLSKERSSFRARNFYAWFFIVTMLFNGGLIPTYLVVKEMNLLDKIWALILPNSISVFNVILMMNFFRGIPREIEEAAFVDGAGFWTSLIKVYLPLSLPSIATITLFIIVGHWNGWFDGMLYMNRPSNWPMQTYLRSIIISPDMTSMTSSEELANMHQVSDRTFKAAQVFLGALPVLMVYPLLQRYFMKGLVMGSVKG